MSTIETLQLNNKRLIEQQSAIQAQVIEKYSIHFLDLLNFHFA